mmetsp:Transcript_13620/g.31917  ORF Transcript_13620/g.31917 Transcript_13620/m.31917 type:complete len:218 (-) Transcript_13620:86-739(-)
MKLFEALFTIQVLCGFAAEGFVTRHHAPRTALHSTTNEAPPSAALPEIDIDPKEAVKVFGRLAEKYIMLDESGGMCCYSACKDCEFRLPDGGYRMADQSAARPKWIPIYEERVFSGQGKEHVSKWNTEIFPDAKTTVTKEEFVEAVLALDFATPLGGPFVSKSAGKLEETTVAECLFDILADGKDTLSRRKMSSGLQKLSSGEAGLNWPSFSAALGL